MVRDGTADTGTGNRRSSSIVSQPPSQKGRQLQHICLKVFVFLTLLSTLSLIYFLLWSPTGSIRYAVSIVTKRISDTSSEVVVDGFEHDHKEEVSISLEKEEEEEGLDDTTLILSSSSCVWDPYDSNADCKDILSNHMIASLSRSRALFLSQPEVFENQSHSVPSILHRRWLLLGDSTVYRLFARLRQYLMVESIERYTKYRASHRCDDHSGSNNSNNNAIDFRCSNVKAGRCDTMEKFHLPRLPKTEPWRLPNFSIGEGPIKFGYNNIYCTDCNGCDSHILECSIANGDTILRCNGDDLHQRDGNDSVASYIGPSYSGYLSVEFARDVELQTLEYKTTQENFLSNYIGNQWNKPIERIVEFGRPICVVSSGHHDIAIPKITVDVYLQNVQWYLELLVQQCDYVIWISNNCPATDNDAYYQTINGTYEWNIGVRNVLMSSKKNRSILSNTFYLDIYNASKTFKHHDHIHMSTEWYQLLASFLQSIMQNIIF